MKTIEIGKLKVNVCQHKGDVSYERFVSFKQYAPQFWEKMDSPLFESYFERIQDHFNKGEFMQGFARIQDYRVAITQAQSGVDAWGVCFGLITEINIDDKKTAEAFKSCPNDAEIENKLKKYKKEGLTANVVTEEVLAFMQASPETFQDQLVHYASQLMMGEMASLELSTLSMQKQEKE